MKRAIAFLLVLPAWSCRETPAAPPPKPDPPSMTASEAHEKLVQLMESQDAQLEGLKRDAASRAQPAAFRRRLGLLRSTAGDASLLPVKSSPSERDALAAEFRAFVALVQELDARPWSADDAVSNIRRIEDQCNRCHQKFSDE